jgi:HK97 family phage prohead protease
MTQNENLPQRSVERTFLLDDLHVRADGGGRIVEAYAAVFNVRSEIRDQDGHYQEENAPGSFARTIAHKAPSGFGVLFNHGRTVDGTPNPLATLPIGVPIEVKTDETGVFTATRYLDNPLADQVLDAIKNGALKAQSYSGRFLKSSRARSASGGLPIIRRDEIDMREYGPAVFAAYDAAAILGTRADTFVRSLLATKPEDRLEWLQQFEISTLGGIPAPDDLTPGTPDGPAELTGEPLTHSNRSNSSLSQRLKRERIRRNM